MPTITSSLYPTEGGKIVAHLRLPCERVRFIISGETFLSVNDSAYRFEVILQVTWYDGSNERFIATFPYRVDKFILQRTSNSGRYKGRARIFDLSFWSRNVWP